MRKRTGKIIACYICSKEIYVMPYLEKITKTCSKDCFKKWKSINAKELNYGKWMTGRKLSKEIIEKREKTKLKKRLEEGYISPFKGKPAWNKDIPWDEKTKRKMSESKIGVERLSARTGKFVNCHYCKKNVYKEKRWFKKNHVPHCSIKCASKLITHNKINACRNLGKSRKGKKLSKEHCKKISDTRKKLIREGKIIMDFPKEDTKIEKKIQNFLKELQIEFFTHQYMKIDHGYLCDVFIPSMNLVIECDGNYWHKYPVGLEKDHIRTKELIEKGFKVLRLWEHEIKVMELKQFREKIND